MKTRTSRYAWIVAFALVSGNPALAADPPKGTPADPSPEVRRQMAAVHKKMVTCLESERPLAECRAEMMESCKTMMGASGCPMMGSMGGGMGPGMGGGMKHGPGMMHGGPPEKAPDK